MSTHLFVRHCQSEHNLTQREVIGGRSHESPPTALGRRQAIAFGKYLAESGIRPETVHHSGAVRTRETCTIALAEAGIQTDPIIDVRLHEVSQGDAEGKQRDEIYTEEVMARLARDGLDGKHMDGESLREAQQRMWDVMLSVEADSSGGPHLYFSHGLAIRALVGKIRGLTKPNILALRTDNLSVTQIDITDGQPQVVTVGQNVIEAIH